MPAVQTMDGEASNDGEVPLLMQQESGIDVIPVVASLKDRLETIRCSEMKRIRRQMGPLSPDQELAIESLTRGIVNNIIDAPITSLEKVAWDADACAVIDIVMRLFDLHCERYQNEHNFAETG